MYVYFIFIQDECGGHQMYSKTFMLLFLLKPYHFENASDGFV